MRRSPCPCLPLPRWSGAPALGLSVSCSRCRACAPRRPFFFWFLPSGVLGCRCRLCSKEFLSRKKKEIFMACNGVGSGSQNVLYHRKSRPAHRHHQPVRTNSPIKSLSLSYNSKSFVSSSRELSAARAAASFVFSFCVLFCFTVAFLPLSSFLLFFPYFP